jgi:hypothetical protein
MLKIIFFKKNYLNIFLNKKQLQSYFQTKKIPSELFRKSIRYRDHVSIEEDPFSSLFSGEKENLNKIDKIFLKDTRVTGLVTNHDPMLNFF